MTHLRAFLLFLFVSLVIGCGGGSGGSSGGNGGNGGGGLTPEARSKALDQIESEYDRLAPRSSPQKRDEFIRFVKANPAFKDAGWSTDGDNFWAVFTDGVGYAILDNRPPNDEGQTAGVRAPKTRASIPEDKRAEVIFSLGNAFTDSTNLLEQSLQEAGYSVTKHNGQLQTLMRGMESTGYFYWNTHSGFLEPDTGKDPVMTTLTEANAASESQEPVKTMLRTGYLTICRSTTDRKPNPTDENGNGTLDDCERLVCKRVYGITPEFVELYFNFGPSSVVVMDSCTSADNVFASKFLEAGAEVYAGWDAVSRAGRTMPLFTDRLLGANVIAPVPDPPIRAFDHAAVVAWMRSNNLDFDGYGARLKVVLGQGAEKGILTPSIKNIDIQEAEFSDQPNVMTVHGDFGPVSAKLKREVFVAGRPVSIVGGDAEKIVAHIPTSGLGSSGNCQVVIGGRKSNVVPITSWIVPVTYWSDYGFGGTARVEIKFRLVFRGDVHKFRNTIGLLPTGRTVTMQVRGDSTATWKASGTTDGDDPDVLSGSGSVKAGVRNQYGSAELGGQMQVDSSTVQLNHLIAFVVGPNFQMTSDDTTVNLPVGVVVDPEKGFPMEFQPGTFTIQGDSVQGTYQTYKYGLQWGTAEPFFPPTEDTGS